MNYTTSLTFIGAGNMSSSIIGGLIGEHYPPQAITACDPNLDALDRLSQTFAIQTTTDNTVACQQSDVIILAVKPQILKSVAEGLQTTLTNRANTSKESLPLIISIAAGITSQQIQNWLGQNVAIVRCMPNTPALVQQGACGLYATAQTSSEQKLIAEQLMQAIGDSVWLNDEALIDSVTAVSGSGPAYFFLLMEAMIDAGVKQGLNKDIATQLTLQTALGAATLAKSSDVSVGELRRRVTSPGGTTEQALNYFEHAGLRDTVTKAMQACADRSKTMAKELN
ncbi:pyrroline-5-carboxylate reductase [Candidatus Endobugula sertula]|uniref:Pyrroline-5-carboxylate reductase n=1 Tax=Candidatus Endobugula sertula TaxID=62101 RepID=A0A1D2QSK5_9GAMM|nr:pyrroline-5-carboxylate reductase [Candidatus Endobugula sertula]